MEFQYDFLLQKRYSLPKKIVTCLWHLDLFLLPLESFSNLLSIGIEKRFIIVYRNLSKRVNTLLQHFPLNLKRLATPGILFNISTLRHQK